MRSELDENIEITPQEIAHIRQLGDFDLKMLLSELDEFGWDDARALLPMIKATEARN